MGNVYKKIEIVGTAADSVTKAVEDGLARAAKTVQHVDWFEVTEIRGRVGDGGSVEEYQVGMKVGFRLK
ncbi:MAG: dodecin family protein [Planctomycetota bacterium]